MDYDSKYANIVVGNLTKFYSSAEKTIEILQVSKLKLSLIYIIKLCENIKSSNIVKLGFYSDVSFVSTILPILLISRFYSKKVILEYSHPNRFVVLDSPNFLVKWILKQFDAVLIDSEPMVRRLRRANINAVHLLPSIDYDNIKFRLRSKIQPLIFMDLSTFDNFNLHCVLSAYKLVKQKYPRTEILISALDKEKIEKEYQVDLDDYPGVEISNDNYASLLERSDIYLNCRFYEFLASTLLESFAYGLPVISTPVGMVDKLYNRNNILLFNFNNHIVLSDLIIELIENQELTEKLSNNGRNLAKSFRPEKVKPYYQSHFMRLLNDN